MREKIALPKGGLQASGRCLIQYTDPVTGRVLEEIRGGNHVFLDQLTGTRDFQNTALKSDLLLCTGGAAIDADIPVIPGYPIGYGRPGSDGAGLFRGAWRSADGYYNRRSRGKVSSKYVYDFLQTQARGKLNWVGLTGALNQGADTAAWTPPCPMQCTTQNKIYDCDTGFTYRLEGSADTSSQTGSKFLLRYADTFSHSAERSVDLLELLGISGLRYNYSHYWKGFFQWETKQFYGLLSYIERGTTARKVVAFRLAADFSAVEETWDISGITDQDFSGSFGYGACRGGRLLWCGEDSAQNYRGFTLYTVEPAAGACTKEYKLYAGPPVCNVFRLDPSTAYCYKQYFWYGRLRMRDDPESSYGDKYFQYAAPMFDLTEGDMVSALPPSVFEYNSPGYYRVGRCPFSLYRGQWGKYYYGGGAPAMPFVPSFLIFLLVL